MTRVLVAGGGTGGHVFPMIAVAEALKAEEPGVEVVFVGTGRGIETRVVPEAGGRLELLDVLPLRGHGARGFVRGALAAMSALPRARALVRRLAPEVVFSVGGYAAGPVTLAARSMGIPVTLLEPNAVWGFTNRVLKPLVQRVYGGFPETVAGLGDRATWTGVPLRTRFEPAPYAARTERVRVLVMGGSQGAVALNEAVPRALARQSTKVGLEVVHQTGREKDGAVRALYRELGLDAEVVPFIDDVADALAAADVVVERAGAGSVAELVAIGRAGLFVPYPYAADDHQRHNAESLAREGAAVCVVQTEASVERLASELGRLVEDHALRTAMAERARLRGRPDAAATIARDLLALARPGRRLTAGEPGGRRRGHGTASEVDGAGAGESARGGAGVADVRRAAPRAAERGMATP